MRLVSIIKKVLFEKNMSSLISNVSVAAAGLASFMLLARQLDKAAFGDWVLYVALASFIDLLRFGLTKTSAVRLLSGAAEEKQWAIMGTSFRINLWLLGAVALVCWPLAFWAQQAGTGISRGYLLFLQWYPILALFNMNWNNATSLFQAEQQFRRMMYVRLAATGSFVLFLAANGLYFKWGLMEILYAHLACNVLASLWTAFAKWDGMAYLGKATRPIQKELIDFGKYSMGTLVGSSLLKSADTFIIGLSPVMGSTAVALYAIPLKLTDLLGIPLRSFTMTAYPRMAKRYHEEDMAGVRKIFYGYTGAVTLLFIPVAVLCFILAEPLILFLGGSNYADSLPQVTLIFRIFTLYTLLLPIDRFSGVALDSINRPKVNLQKVVVMTIANVVIDLIGVFVFQSLEVVAIGTIVFTMIGIGIGMRELKRELQVQSRYIWTEGLAFFKNLKSFLAV
ncbi:oligosaccharide flippase family protein [Phaeodactylibacter xiamenensis]|jgi:O-antigen/teichoic acid export membrane protein|uniref:oligosaccharide flippase family protein n=1 Tax=Phaeodactylibacter xiamenensis TaxID=1524460 RepID=UPI0024A98A9F|nr:oligosaccharide flippase family protein [Phaeodactylibacter xiamenensis]